MTTTLRWRLFHRAMRKTITEDLAVSAWENEGGASVTSSVLARDHGIRDNGQGRINLAASQGTASGWYTSLRWSL